MTDPLAAFSAALTARVRREEAELLSGVLAPRGPFRRLLELGAGDGFQAARWGRLGRVFPSDLARAAAARLPDFVQCSGQALPYRGASFDAVVSSNVLEHVADLPGVLGELARVARPGAVFVHVLPTRFWKVLHLITHYPYTALALGLGAWRRWARGRPAAPPGGPGSGVPTGRPAPGAWRRLLIPEVHGASASHRQEFRAWKGARWCRAFERAGYRVEGVRPLLAYSPALPLVPVSRRLALLGLPSTVAYVLSRERHGRP